MKKTNLKKPVLAAISATILSTLAACGGDATIPGQGSIATQEGQFIDSPVQGLRYDAGSGITGVTDEDGKFRYIQGKEISFFIGETLLGTAEGSQIMTPVNLAKAENENNGINSPALLNRLKLLQALDSDGNPDNGITLLENVTLPGTTTLNFAVDVVNFVTQPVVNSLLNLFGRVESDLPTDTQALEHFEEYALTNLLQGCYVGNIRDIGAVTLKVNPNGSINGLVPLQSGATPTSVTGTMRGDGSFSFGPVGALDTFVGEVVPIEGQSIGVFSYEAMNAQGGLISRNPLKFPSFDVSGCSTL